MSLSALRAAGGTLASAFEPPLKSPSTRTTLKPCGDGWPFISAGGGVAARATGAVGCAAAETANDSAARMKIARIDRM